jgi:PBSX family phage portal protein
MTQNSDVPAAGAQIQPGPIQIEAFAFGDDVSVLDGRGLWDYFEGVTHNGDWYEPPVPMAGLARSFRMSPAHQSAVQFKVNQLARHFVPTRWMSAETHAALALDLLQMGNLFAEELPNMAGRPLAIRRSPALHTRVGVQPGRYFFVKAGIFGLGTAGAHEFTTRVHHVFELDVEQEVYGVPQWLSALQSGLLNESATLFRRRYYLNGAHAGFVFYLNEPTIDTEAASAIKDRLKNAKGVGNFKNLFIHAPGGKKDGVQILPIAEVAAKDEFAGIKNVTRDDLMVAHRMVPQLIGIIPQNNGGFGDPRSAMDVFFVNEIEPIMAQMLRLNTMIGVEAVKYAPYQPMMPGTATG